VTRLLYVEDNDDNVFMLKMRLDLIGDYEVLVATDGAGGIAQACNYQPDLILMDLHLPGIDGWEATRRLKADPGTRDIPIIAFTADAMAGDRERALAAGCDDFETKPIDFSRLVKKIEAMIARRAE
jgi:two-component system, cell cycle response regulator DivK